jgi:hypothetical protein
MIAVNNIVDYTMESSQTFTSGVDTPNPANLKARLSQIPRDKWLYG